MPELVRRAAEPREGLGLELDLVERLASDGDQLADPVAVHEEADRAAPGRVARGSSRGPEVDLPEGGLSVELPGRRWRRRGLAVPEAPEASRQVGRLDRDSRGRAPVRPRR